MKECIGFFRADHYYVICLIKHARVFTSVVALFNLENDVYLLGKDRCITRFRGVFSWRNKRRQQEIVIGELESGVISESRSIKKRMVYFSEQLE